MLRWLDLVGKWASRVENENKGKDSCCSLLTKRYNSQSLPSPTSGFGWRPEHLSQAQQRLASSRQPARMTLDLLALTLPGLVYALTLTRNSSVSIASFRSF